MLPDKWPHMLIGVAVAIQCLLLLQLISINVLNLTPLWWFFSHVLLNAVAALCTVIVLMRCEKRIKQPTLLFVSVFTLSVFIPLTGSMGAVLSMVYGIRAGQKRHRGSDYWQLTPRAELPYTTPKNRLQTSVDSRGFVEHLMYSSDDDDLYRKVLSAANIKSSLSVATLKQAMRHDDEHVRLTAYKTLDRKVTQLNQQIQTLESQVSHGNNLESSNTWLQIASNYWELLTLEDGVSVARHELMEKVADAAIEAVAILPENRNAHFVLGRVSLMQGDTERAGLAFKRCKVLGMPADKVLPYLAETAYAEKDFVSVSALLHKLGSVTRTYPPLSHVVEHWT